jgi:hypothetical protein
LYEKSNGVTFYKPVEIPDGFFILGHYCQSNDEPLRGYVLAAQNAAPRNNCTYVSESESSALKKPVNYSLIWSSGAHHNQQSLYIWQPNAPAGYITMGFVVTSELCEPDLEEVRCVRADLTDNCESGDLILNFDSLFFSKNQFQVWNTRPCERGILGRGVSAGTFFCSTDSKEDPDIFCLKNMEPTLHAMPNLDQIHALINHYGPTVFFHPDEAYLPSSVPWFFKNGALLYRDDKDNGISIDSLGLILPAGGKNDGKFWVDLPEEDDERNLVKNGNMESAKLYVHVKPALGGTFTDIVMWIFCPFNGPSTIKAGLVTLALNKIGQHVSDWEHYTLRLSNFTGELCSVYFSEHSGGEWVNVSELEFMEGNKVAVYSSKHGHASYPHAGSYIQGSSKLGIGLKNDCARSNYVVDSSVNYEIVAAEHLGNEVEEPHWLQYMREWGPTVVYDSRTELDKIISHLPFIFRFSVEIFFELFPTELYGEEGPTGPKEKDNWVGDER